MKTTNLAGAVVLAFRPTNNFTEFLDWTRWEAGYLTSWSIWSL
jgi:hypothetical protein